MKIGILFGGKSFEHDISIITANTIYQILKDKYDLYLLYINREGLLNYVKKMDIEKFVNGEKMKEFSFINGGIKCRRKKHKIDVVINAMHGINGEDGLASTICNLYNIPFVGSNHISSGILMDKYFTYAILLENNIKVIETKYIMKDEKIGDNYVFPLIIKPARLGSSIGINVCKCYDEFKEKLDSSFTYDNKVVIQPYISNFKEVNQAAYYFNNEIHLSNVEEVFKHDDILSFKDKYEDVKIDKNKIFVKDACLIEKISDISKKIYSLFELSGVVRIDYMIIGDEVYVNEINTTPGSLSFYLFDDGINIFKRMIYEALKKYQNRPETTFLSSILYQKNIYKK